MIKLSLVISANAIRTTAVSDRLFEAQQLSKSYGIADGQVDALKNVNFSIDKGKFVAITGPSGSGKSTLLSLMGMLARPTDGVLSFQGENIAHLDSEQIARLRNAEIGFVFQSFQLLDRTTAIENVELPLIYAKIPSKERCLRACEALTRVGLADRLDHYPAQLSGGEQQRVAIARAIVNKPSVILADEPTGALDTATGREILELLQDLNQQGTSVVVITHNPEIAEGAEQHMALVDGRIQTASTVKKTASAKPDQA